VLVGGQGTDDAWVPRALGGSPPRVPRRSLWQRVRTVVVVLAVLTLLVGGRLVWPTVAGWVDYLAHGDPKFRTGVVTGTVARPADGRVRAAVPVPPEPDPSEFAFSATDGDGSPVTFDPCRPIHYVISDPVGVGEPGREVIADAATAMSEASGLALVFDGYDSAAQAPDGEPTVTRHADAHGPVVIGWSDEHATPGLAGPVLGLGGPTRLGDGGAVTRYVSGVVSLDTPALRPRLATASGRALVRAVVMHELGHVLGAGHTESTHELMAASSGQQELGEGDRYVFARLGSGRCFTAP